MKILLCCTGYLAATLLSYSQTPEAPAAEKPTPLTLPADNVALVDVNGTTITATVLSMAADKLSIVIRTAEGKEMPILMSRLNAATIEKLTGVKPLPSRIVNGVKLPGTYDVSPYNGSPVKELVVDITNDGIVIHKNGNNQEIPFIKLSYGTTAFFRGTTPQEAKRYYVALAKERRANNKAEIDASFEFETTSPIAKEFFKMSAKDAAQLLTNPPEGDGARFLEAKKLRWDIIHRTRFFSSSMPAFNEQTADGFVYPSDMLKGINLENIPLNEKVSLRPEFEKYGIKPMSESFKEIGCEYQACYKIMNFWLSKKNMPKVTLDEFWRVGSNTPYHYDFRVTSTMNNGSKTITPPAFGKMLRYRIGIQPKQMTLITMNKPLSYELAKEMLRKGRPIIADIPSNIGYRHVVAIVGFETKDGATQFEVLDHSYFWEKEIRFANDCWVFWYE